MLANCVIKEDNPHLQVLNFLDKLDILLGEALLVGCDVHNSAVQFLDLDVELADVYLQLLAGLGDGDLLLGDILNLGQKLVYFSLELGFLFLGPGDKEMMCEYLSSYTIFERVRVIDVTTHSRDRLESHSNELSTKTFNANVLKVNQFTYV